ncbi:MAG: glycine--tRNA ligase [Deltaproteobacteria bacterium]|nr:glycine--tRNA ligase [Deltaproteobacteria bacterium]
MADERVADKQAGEEKMAKVVSLCKRRGFIFPSSEIYGGLKSCYDYGPLGVELKRNVMAEWWRAVVYEREDIVGLDASIMMHPRVWEASGHVAGFQDPLVDCRNCKERFRADKAPRAEQGTEVEYLEGGKKGGKKLRRVVERSYVCPVCGSPDLSEERMFNLMFRTNLGPVQAEDSTIYLRPETAQAMFVQFENVQATMSMKVPFGIAQTGKSFRNEVTVEHFIFRSVEFEQMEIEFFVEPGTQAEWMDHWTKERVGWYRRYLNKPDDVRLRRHEKDELAHYADDCCDVEYFFPWGWDELEGIASRTDYDLRKHAEHSGKKLSYFDQNKPDPATGKPGWRYVPYVVEPSAGATRSVLMLLCDAYDEEPATEPGGEPRVVLRLHPRLAPYKVAVFPLVKKDGLPELARDVVKRFYKAGIHARYDEQHSIGKRYRRHDEAGTPYCLTIDGQTKEDGTVTIRDRDTMKQERISLDAAVRVVRRRLGEES